jgi:hypothetical protein
MSKRRERNPDKWCADGKGVTCPSGLADLLRAWKTTDAKTLVVVGELDIAIEGEGVRKGVVPEAVTSEAVSAKVQQ